MNGQHVKAVHRASRVVDAATRAAAIETVIAAMEAGRSFSGAAAIVAAQIGVNESTVRTWVNESGRRPHATMSDLQSLRAALEEATALNRRLAAQLESRA